MKAMVFLGNKATAKVVQRLKSMSDDVDYSVYSSVSNFVQDAETRHLSFNRVVFNNKFTPNGEEDFVRLNEFIHSFSSGTELVMVINSGDTESESLFNKYFSSPMHSCAIVKNAASMDFFRDVVSLPISDVKARYYVLDKETGGAVTAKSVESKLGSFMGGFKKPANPVENSSVKSNISEHASNMESSASDFSQGFVEENPVEPVSKPESFVSAGDFSSPDFKEASDFSNEVRGSVEPSSFSAEDFSEEDEDDILSVGEFGSAHSDTDMFDEEEESDEAANNFSESNIELEERKRREELEEQNRIAARIQEEERRKADEARRMAEEASEDSEKNKSTPISSPKNFEEPLKVEPKKPVQTQKPVKKSWPVLSETPYEAYNVNFVVSAGGIGSAQQIIDDAVRMMEAGMRVLIVDLDFNHNGILSFIDTSMYYSKNNNAFSGGSVYVEEKIGVVSGGYGFVPSKEEIKKVFSIGVISKYDIVIVDCPVSSVRYVGIEMLSVANIIVFSDSDPSQFIVTAMAITNRNYCTLEQERLIMKKGRSILTGNKKDLLEETISKMFFANGCWLD